MRGLQACGGEAEDGAGEGVGGRDGNGSAIGRRKTELKLGGPAADEAFVEVARRPVNSSAQPVVLPEKALEVGVGSGRVGGYKIEGSERSDAMSLGELLYYVLVDEGRSTDETA